MTALQTLLEEFLAAHESMPGVLLHVEAPGLSWDGAAGVVERGGGTLAPGSCFRTASVTKTFVATAVLRLVERGDVGLDDVATLHLPEPALSMLTAAVPGAGRITVRHLLQHTSGIYDFGKDDEHFGSVIVAEPQKVWTAEDQLAVAFDHGTPYCDPGAEFHYSDTGYVLLALILERHTGLPFAAALRSLVGLDDLGLTSTWLEGKEPVPHGAPTRAHQYMGRVDTYGFDPSFDGYGGGGLVSTGRDLATFLRALVGGRLLAPATLAEMLTFDAVTDLGDIGQRCGLGIFQSTIGGLTRVGHEGYWGVWMYHYPALDVTIAGAHTGLPYDLTAKHRLLRGAALAAAAGRVDPHAAVLAQLAASGIEHRLSVHEPTLTSRQAAEYRGVDASTGAKSLVVASKDGMALFVIPGDAQLDWKKVRAVGYRNARLADDDELLAATGLVKGAVSPLGGLVGLPVFLDRALTELDLVRFNAASRTESVEIRGADLPPLTGGTVGDFRATSR